WQKFMFDKGLVPQEEFAKKLINQGMILGTSAFVYRVDFKFHWSTTSKEFKQPSLTKPIFINYKSFKEYDGLYNFILDSTISAENKNMFVNGNGFTKGLASIVEDTVYFDLLDDERKNILSSYMEIYRFVIDDIYKQNLWFFVEILAFTPLHVDVSFANASDELDIVAFKNWRPEFKDAIFIGESGKDLSLGEDLGESFKVGRDVEKMSKSKYNLVNPD